MFAVVHGASQGSGGTALYTTDTSTLLFDNFENTSLADSRSAAAVFADGYIEGRALFLSDTGAHAVYSDSWWQENVNGSQESGTIEFYYRPETFLFAPGVKDHGMLLTILERSAGSIGGLPQFSIFEVGTPVWAISTGNITTQYFEAAANDQLNPGQWYHLAATWGNGFVRLYRNDTLIASAPADSAVRADTFLIGATGNVSGAFGLAARGRMDRLRISNRIRVTGEFPSALDVVITSPLGLDTVVQPFLLAYRAFASDTRARVVDLYTDTDENNFNGTLIRSGLTESGTAMITGLADTYHFFYAVARAGNDSAFFRVANQVRVLGVTGASVSQSQGVGACLLTRMKISMSWMRYFRDVILEMSVGRKIVEFYYLM